MNITITHNGKEYKDIESAFNQALIDGIKSVVMEKLNHIMPQIEQEHGIIEVKVNGDDMAIVLDGFSPELTQSITEALRKDND
jgi:hypothetical protein